MRLENGPPWMVPVMWPKVFGPGTQGCVWRGQVGEVEDVGGFTANLELYALLVEQEVAEDGGVDTAAAGCAERILAYRSVGVGRAGAILRAGRHTVQGRIPDTELGDIGPVLHGRHARVAVVVYVRNHARRGVGTIVRHAVGIVIRTGGDVERKSALHADDGGNCPSVDQMAHGEVADAVVRLVHKRDHRKVALVVVGTLAVEELVAVVFRLRSGAVARVAGGVQVFALQVLRPDVEALDAEVVRHPLLCGDLQGMVVGALRRLNLRDGGKLRIGCRGGGGGAVACVVERPPCIQIGGRVGVGAVQGERRRRRLPRCRQRSG